MAVSEVRSNSGKDSDQTVTVSFGAAPAEDNLMVVYIWTRSKDTATPSGWTRSIEGGGGDSLGLFTKLAGPSEGTSQDFILDAADQTSWAYYELTDVDTTTPVRAVVFEAPQTVTSLTSGTTDTTPQADDYAICAFGSRNDISAQSFTNSFTLDLNPDPPSPVAELTTATKLLTASGAVESTMSWTTSSKTMAIMGVFKAAAGGAALTETVTEAVGVTDETPIKQGKAIAEAAGIGDVVSRVHTAKRTPTEPVGLADSTLPAKAITVAIDEAVGVSDETPIKQSKVIDEAVGVTDETPIKQSKVITEPVGLSDDTTRVIPWTRVIDEAVGVTDETPIKQSKVITEPVGITDLVEDKLTIAQEVDEPVGITDTAQPAKTIRVTITEAVGVTDETPIKQSKVITEPIGITEVVVVVEGGDKFETITEAAGVTDTTTRVVDAARVITEPAGITDTTQPAKSITVVIDEAVGVGDSTLTAKATALAIDEAVGVADTTSRVVDAARVIVEALGVADSTLTAKATALAIDEAVGVADTTSRVVDAARVIVEALGVADDTTRVITWTRAIDEAVGVADSTIPFLPTAGVLELQALAVGRALARITVGKATTLIAVAAPEEAITLNPS